MSAILKKVLVFSLALMLCFSLVGCAENEGPLTSEQIDQIITEAVNGLAEAETYKFDMDLSLSMEAIGGTDPGTMSMSANATGAIDNVNEEMYMLMDMTMNMPEQGGQEMGMDMYIVGEWVYVRMSIPGLGEQWMKMALTPEMWEMQKQTEQQMELLETAMRIELVGSESVDGVDCYVFEITPDMGKLAGYLAGTLGMQGLSSEEMGAFGWLFGDLFEDLFKELSIKEWIAKDSSLFVKAEVHMAIEVSPEDVGATAEDFEKLTMDMDIGMAAHDYNEPVSIELPPEALDALEIPAL
jgi:hypothetical protein